MENKTDTAWNKIFEELNILNKLELEGVFLISSNQIKSISNREPRLLTKFDNSASLPNLFKKYDISILPVTRGDYIISRQKIFEKLEEPDPTVIYVRRSHDLDTLNENITTETQAINTIFNNGILESFINENNLLTTTAGKQKSSKFSFNIKNLKNGNYDNVVVNNSQIETDAIFENKTSVVILEAKTKFSEDFLVRQLYYPFRTIKNITNKKIRLVYFVFTKFFFNLYEYNFKDENNYNSIKLVKKQTYSFVDYKLNRIKLKNEIIKEEVKNSTAPFPQANSLVKIIDLLNLTKEKKVNKDDVTKHFGFDKRQTDYYLNACIYLELVEKDKNQFLLRKNASRSIDEGNIVKLLIVKILKQKEFNTIFENIESTDLTVSNVFKFIKKESLLVELNDTTIKRRASTITKWLKWVNSSLT